ncbi:hypothetical protein F5I97DRAFT_1817119, partial [Phlebopus sp. FC_14]
SSPDCIVCINACFIQKHSKNTRSAEDNDPINPTSSVFISLDLIRKMKVQADQSCSRMHECGRPINEDDHMEDGMHVPVSVLEGCEESFIVADKKREKTSTQFFMDIGLMALLCHHDHSQVLPLISDHVLWLVNLTSAKEKQHYAFVLIKQLIEHLLDDMMVRLLYNIGCQPSCI